MRTLSTAALRAGHAQETGEVYLILLTISHPDLTAPIRVVNNNENVTSRNNFFVAFPFAIELPLEDSDQPPRARLRIDNVDRSIVASIRAIDGPPTVTIEVILASQPNTVEASFEALVLRNVSYDAATVTGELAFEQIVVEPVASNFTPAKFPGLF